MRLLSKIVVIGVTLSALGLPIETNGQQRKEPMIIGGDVGVDGSYCETAKADFDMIAAVARERDSNVIIITRLGQGEYSRSIGLHRLSEMRSYLMLTRGYEAYEVVTGEGERVRGLGLVEVYIEGKPFIIYRMKRNKYFIRGNAGC